MSLRDSPPQTMEAMAPEVEQVAEEGETGGEVKDHPLPQEGPPTPTPDRHPH